MLFRSIATAIHPAATHMSFPLKLDRIALKRGFAPIMVAIPYGAQWLSFRMAHNGCHSVAKRRNLLFLTRTHIQ